jgi:hypothetical protein
MYGPQRDRIELVALDLEMKWKLLVHFLFRIYRLRTVTRENQSGRAIGANPDEGAFCGLAFCVTQHSGLIMCSISSV